MYVNIQCGLHSMGATEGDSFGAQAKKIVAQEVDIAAICKTNHNSPIKNGIENLNVSNISLSLSLSLYIYIYIYREREIDR